MIKFENTQVMGWEGAIRGMRNPMNSWGQSDSYYNERLEYVLGEKDLALAVKLRKAGSDHRKYLRQIFVSVDITAPAYFMAEFDTYKVGTTRNSSSFQHKGVSKPFEIEDFAVPSELYEILSVRTPKDELPQIEYKYETDEYRRYTTGNGRTYRVYKNGRVVCEAFTWKDTIGRERNMPEHECRPSITAGGYWGLILGGRNGEKWQLHRLVAYVWCDNPEGCDTVDHLNSNKNDNCAENLQWVTRRENIRREWEDGLVNYDKKHNYKIWKYNTRIFPDQRYTIQKLYATGNYTQRQLAEQYGVKQAQISAICRNTQGTSPDSDLFALCWHWEQILEGLNILRQQYLETREESYFYMMRAILPMSYLYRSTVSMNYENLIGMYHGRKYHMLPEWREGFCNWVKSLPYADELIICEDNNKEGTK